MITTTLLTRTLLRSALMVGVAGSLVMLPLAAAQASPGGTQAVHTRSASAPAAPVYTLMTPKIESTAVPTAFVGDPFDYTLTVTGSPTPTVTVTGALPKGITFDGPTRRFSGTPTETGVFNLVVTADNGTTVIATRALAILVSSRTVNPTDTPVPTVTPDPTSPPSTSVGQPLGSATPTAAVKPGGSGSQGGGSQLASTGVDSMSMMLIALGGSLLAAIGLAGYGLVLGRKRSNTN